MQTLLFVDSSLRELFVGNVRDGQKLTDIGSRQLLQCTSVCFLIIDQEEPVGHPQVRCSTTKLVEYALLLVRCGRQNLG